MLSLVIEYGGNVIRADPTTHTDYREARAFIDDDAQRLVELTESSRSQFGDR
jgi:hypothetical protein